MTYAKVMQSFEMPVGTDKVKVCPMCRNLLHLVQMNPYVWFWVHRGDDLKRCAEANTRFHKPLIANNLGFYNKMVSEWAKIAEKHNRRVRKHEFDGSAKDKPVPKVMP